MILYLLPDDEFGILAHFTKNKARNPLPDYKLFLLAVTFFWHLYIIVELQVF